MAAKSSSRRRILWTVLIVFLLLVVLGVGEVFRRFFEREEVAAISRVLTEARVNKTSLAKLDPEWDELSESLRDRVEEDPTGLLAIQAYRARMRVSHDLPGSISLADRPTATLKYGALVERDVPLPDQPYLWAIEIQGSWDGGPWFEWYRTTWDGEGQGEAEFALDTGLTDAQRERGHAILMLRVLLKLYLGDPAIAVAEAAASGESGRVPVSFQEHESMGKMRIWTNRPRTPEREP